MKEYETLCKVSGQNVIKIIRFDAGDSAHRNGTFLTEVSLIVAFMVPPMQSQTCSLQAHFSVHGSHGGLVVHVHERQQK